MAEAKKKEFGEGPDYQLDKAYKMTRRGAGIDFNDEWFEEHDFKDLPEQIDLNQTEHIVVGGEPLKIIDKFYEIIKKKYDQVKVSEKTWKIKFQATGKFTEPNFELNKTEQE